MEKSRSFTSRPAEDRSCRMMLAWHFWFGEVGSGKKPTWPPLAQGQQMLSGARCTRNQASGVGGWGAALQMLLSET